MGNEVYENSLLIPQEFWDDEDWVYNNYNALVRIYPDQWIAVVDKQVVASGENSLSVIKLAEQKTKRKEFPVIFLEKTFRVY